MAAKALKVKLHLGRTFVPAFSAAFLPADQSAFAARY
jgi:hypothetical protein